MPTTFDVEQGININGSLTFREDTGTGALLTVGTVGDGQLLVRSGLEILGTGAFSGGSLTGPTGATGPGGIGTTGPTGPSSLQAAYDGSTTNPTITLNGKQGCVSIRDNSVPVTGALFSVQNNTGDPIFEVTSAQLQAFGGTGSGESAIVFSASGVGNADYGVILGGDSSTLESAATGSAIIGSSSSEIFAGENTVILGGEGLSATGHRSALIGGDNNQINTSGSTGASVIVGGCGHLITGEKSNIIGGSSSTVSGDASVILGGLSNSVASDTSLVSGESVVISSSSLSNVVAFGQNINIPNATGSNSFLFADGGSTGIDLDQDNQFKARSQNVMFCSGGTSDGSNGSNLQITHNGADRVAITPGATGVVWSLASITDHIYLLNNIQVYGRGRITGRGFAFACSTMAENVSGVLNLESAQGCSRFEPTEGSICLTTGIAGTTIQLIMANQTNTAGGTSETIDFRTTVAFNEMEF